jgi:hypothetical protein
MTQTSNEGGVMANLEINRRRSGSEWQAIISEQKSSGQTAAAYCRKHGISEKSFYNRRGKMRLAAVKPAPKSFIEIRSDQEFSSRPLTLHIPGGYRLDVPRGADGTHVKAIVTALVS